MLTFYGYPRCSTCRNAAKWLDAHGHSYQYIDITEQPPSASLLRRIAGSEAYSLRSLFNTSGQLYRQMDLKARLPDMSEAEAIDLLAKHGKLIKRPIVTDGADRFSVGFKPETYEQVWGEGEQA